MKKYKLSKYEASQLLIEIVDKLKESIIELEDYPELKKQLLKSKRKLSKTFNDFSDENNTHNFYL